MKKLLLLSFLCFVFAATYSQETFKGKSAVKECKIKLKIKYRNADKDFKRVSKYMGKEIVWVHKGKTGYEVKRVYLVVEEVKGETYIYLKTKETKDLGNPKDAIFINFGSGKNMFYLAECYDSK